MTLKAPRKSVINTVAALICAAGLVSAADSDVLFKGNFADAQSGDVQTLFKTYGDCAINDGALVLNGLSSKSGSAAAFVRGSDTWTNYAVACTFRLTRGEGHVGVHVRRPPRDNGLYVFLPADEENLCYSVFTTTRRKRLSHGERGRHTLRVVCNGLNATVHLDGRKVFHISPVPAHGGVWFKASKATAAFSEVTVTNSDTAGPTAASPNILANSSFETPSASNIPDYWGLQTWGLRDDNWIGRLDELWQRWRRDTESPYHGDYCLRVDGIQRLARTMLALKTGENYVLSGYLRSDRPLPVDMVFYNWRGPTWTKTVTTTEKWERYVYALDPVERGKSYFAFLPQAEGVLWVDAVQLEQGTHASPYRPSDSDGRGDGSRDAAVPKASAVDVTQAPHIDGVLDDAAWSEARRLPLVLRNGDQPRDRTDALLAYDERNLYLGFRCYDHQMDRLTANVKQRDGFVWLDDCIEVFLNPSTRENYYHLGVSVTGAQYDGLKNNPAWNGSWLAKTHRFDDRWEVELALPFEMFGLSAFDTGGWRLNLCRENRKAYEYSCWSPTFESSFHDEKRFGILSAFPAEVSDRWEQPARVAQAPETPPMPPPFTADGAPSFRFGLDWGGAQLPGTNTFAAMRAAHMNTLELVLRERLLSSGRYTLEEVHKTVNAAQRFGIKTVIRVNRHGNPSEAHLRLIEEIVTALKTNDNILGWIVLDEPHSHPDMVRQAVDLAKTLDPRRPAWINVTPQGLGMRIAGLPGDAVMVDRYPVEFDGSVIRDVGIAAREAAGVAYEKDVPTWMFLQTMSNSLWVWRSVTPEELTAQTYEAIVSGVTGIVFFTGIPLPQNTWARMKTLGAELKQIQPALISREVLPVPCTNAAVDYTAKKVEDACYLLAVNPTETAQTAVLDLDRLFEQMGPLRAERCFSSTDAAVSNRRLVATLAPYERCCYRLTPISAPQTRDDRSGRSTGTTGRVP